uniref:tRNA (adenine(58)-N(1))-methyltransferase TrmI n=1 Tax=candidate division WOR-3 bacterium TaxID=2052148 RepID=A0A7C4XK08_UNCW3
MKVISEGTLVYIYLDEKREYLVQIQSGKKLSTDFGNIEFSEIVGKDFGYKGKTHLGRDYYCLKPTTGDLMLKIKRKTTIVYPKDTGYLLFETAIGPGSRVIEVGTGSGALTYFLSKAVGDDGFVYSYERSEEFLNNAKENLKKLGCNNIEFFAQDVAEKGFLQKDVDAVFIDVPEPWQIVPWAFIALKGGHHLCAWSPNVEQVKKTVESLRDNNFIRIKVNEILQREILVRERGTRPKERGITHTAYLISATKFNK